MEQDGYITVVAATCYNNSNTQTLFDLYQINRNGTSISSLTKLDQIKDNTGNVVFDFNKQRKLTEYGCLYYFEIPVEKGEYVLSADATSSTGAYLAYLDIGTNGESTPTTTDKNTISDIDFVKLGCTTTPFSESYNYTNLLFEIKISGSSVSVILYFVREDDNSDTPNVTYNTGENIVITPIGETSNASIRTG